MKKLPKEILNYFATYTETRFNFRRLINYKWTNDELTLDLSLFPEFQHLLLNKIKGSDISPVSIKAGDFTLFLKKEEVILEIEKLLRGKFNREYLENCIAKEIEDMISSNQIFIAGENGEVALAEGSKEGQELLEKQSQEARQEGIRKYNLSLTRQIETSLTGLQRSFIAKKKEELNADFVLQSIFGVTNYVNQHFQKLKILSGSYTGSTEYIEAVLDYFRDSVEDIAIYDLFYNLQKYAEFIKSGTLFLFFHMLERKNEAYPLYFIELDFRTSNTEVTVSFPRDLIILNAPAINYFKFENVLTIPRASSIATVGNHLGAIEIFLQNQYGFQNPFILETCFGSISPSDEEYPFIRCRIGLQVIVNEDKKLLDYSELMTRTGLGESDKFANFIDQYIRGKVPNYQDEVDLSFREKYSIKKPQRYIPDGPIPVNNSQKRIILAIANEKNRVIVVDGPPGTGKSHAIAAITYWANEQGKSVVVTSHKKEALDVIDRMLTDKYKTLHPQAKPSIVRMDKETGSPNSLRNTLSAPVLGAANERVIDFNKEAVERDQQQVEARIFSGTEERIKSSGNYEENIKDAVDFEMISRELEESLEMKEILAGIGLSAEEIDFVRIEEFADSGHCEKLSQTSLEEFAFILEHKNNIPEFLEACEKLHNIPADVREIQTNIDGIPADFTELLTKLQKHFRSDALVSEISVKDASAGILQKISGKALSQDDLKGLIQSLGSLKYDAIIKEVARVQGKEKREMTISDLVGGADKILSVLSLKRYKILLESYNDLPGNRDKDIGEIFDKLNKYRDTIGLFEEKTYIALKALFGNYGTLLNHLGVIQKDLETMTRLQSHDEKAGKVWRWIKTHCRLSKRAETDSLNPDDLQAYFRQRQKKTEYLNDSRLKNLNKHLGEMERIKVSYEGGKRFSVEESRVLLDSISCVIAEPASISKYFPMEEDLLDILIIDEASQVSIADSISLILRAKQVVIFGDEYQYGAVSAFNVNAKYSASYFSKIISAYADDYSANVSEVSSRELVEAVSREVSSEDQESDILLKPQEGTVLWLKTFNIRTSTLTFAKAIANYSTALKEHFRSFPEIVSYSNDFFYKVAQLELVVNRIRTKPIGEVLQFMNVSTKGLAGPNTNLDEIEAIADDIQKRLDAGFKGTIGVITSFKEQQTRMEQIFNERFNLPVLRNNHKLTIWFVGDVQGEERDIVYYSFVEDKKLGNASLTNIYPVVGGTADNIRSLRMQRLNVGFSRAKDTMVFVLSQPIDQYSHTRLGNALKHYWDTLEINRKNDFFVEDESVFDSPMEKNLYSLLLDTDFVKRNREHIRIIPQFDIGKYIAREYAVSIPKYRTDFLVTLTRSGKEQALILEYDGVEYHFKNPNEVDALNFSREYLDYDISRQLELESYGYRFLRINKFNLRPRKREQTEADVLNNLLEGKFSNNA